MALTVGMVARWLDAFAPFQSAEAFDNVGVLLGDPAATAERVVFCVDATPDVAREAIRMQARLIVSHHPLMFGGVDRISCAEPEGEAIALLLGNGINLIAAHTNLDRAEGGVADSLARAISLQRLAPCGDNPFARVGDAERPMSSEAYAAFVSDALHATVRRYGAPDRPVARVAVGPGACGDGYRAALAAGADAFVVGEIHHHELLAACGRGLTVLEVGHYASELPGVQAQHDRFVRDAASNHWQVEPLLYLRAPYPGAARDV